jgi:hypothetical protein
MVPLKSLVYEREQGEKKGKKRKKFSLSHLLPSLSLKFSSKRRVNWSEVGGESMREELFFFFFSFLHMPPFIDFFFFWDLLL